MKHLFLFTVLSAFLCFALNSAHNPITREAPSENLVILQMTPSTAEYDVYTLVLECPNCHKTMYADFKKGVGSKTNAKCKNCYKQYTIQYSWPSDRKQPTIQKITEFK